MLLAKASSLVIVFATALFSAAEIRDVDFKNFVYPWDPPHGVPEVWSWLPGKAATGVHLNAGQYEFTGPSFVALVSFSSVTYGDLDGDGHDEAAVDLYCSTGGTANWHYLYVFTLANGTPRLMARLESGSRHDGGLVKIAVEQQTLILEFEDPNRFGPACCSDGYVRMKYRWQGGRFVETDAPEHGDLR